MDEDNIVEHNDVVSFINYSRYSVLDAFGKYMDDDKALSKAKEKLTRTVVDVEVSRKRKQGNHDESKAQEIQDEYDALQLKLESYKVNFSV